MTENWTELVIGIIMIISPWIFGFSDVSVAKWCNVLIGIALVLVNAWTIFGERVQLAPTVEESKKKRTLKNNVEQKITA
jgi:hypothetical protein